MGMVEKLKSRYPEFPPEKESEKPMTFVRILLNTCQLEYEKLPAKLDPSEEEKENMQLEELDEYKKERKDKAMANMKFIGNLYIRRLLAVKVINEIIHDLLSDTESNPEEYKVECACELLTTVGYTLEANGQGEALMTKFCARLVDLKRASSPDSKKPGTAFSKRLQFIVQDLLDLRQKGWQKKFLKEQAKTKEDIRIAAAKADEAGLDAVQFETSVVGARPSGTSNSRYSGAYGRKWA